MVACKEEAKKTLWSVKHREDVDGAILFSGAWVWAAHLVGAIRDYALTGKGVLVWTHPGFQGWRTVEDWLCMVLSLRLEFPTSLCTVDGMSLLRLKQS